MKGSCHQQAETFFRQLGNTQRRGIGFRSCNGAPGASCRDPGFLPRSLQTLVNGHRRLQLAVGCTKRTGMSVPLTENYDRITGHAHSFTLQLMSFPLVFELLSLPDMPGCRGQGTLPPGRHREDQP